MKDSDFPCQDLNSHSLRKGKEKLLFVKLRTFEKILISWVSLFGPEYVTAWLPFPYKHRHRRNVTSHHFTSFLFISFHFFVYSNFFGSYQLKSKNNSIVLYCQYKHINQVKDQVALLAVDENWLQGRSTLSTSKPTWQWSWIQNHLIISPHSYFCFKISPQPKFGASPHPSHILTNLI